MKSLSHKSLSKIISIILNILWWIEWVGSIILISVIIISSFLKKSISLNFPVTFSSVRFKTIPSANKNIPESVLNVMNGNFYVPVNNSWQNILMLLAGSIIMCALIIAVTYQLKLIFLSLRNNEPFDERNVLRIRNTGMLLILFAFLHFLSGIIINHFLLANYAWDESIKLTYTFKLSCLIAGVILIIVAEIFKEGAALKEETNLTI